MANFILILIAGYVIGALSSAYLITRLVTGIDLRRYGTGNIGTSNMYQATRRKSLIPVVAAWDIGKPWLPLYFATLAGLSLEQAGAVAVATVIGHNWPFYLGFKGGRGMMTTLGIGFALPVLYGLNPPWPIIIGFSLFLIVSAAMLVGLLFGLGVEQRAGEMGLLLAVGYPVKLVRSRLMAEGAAIAVVGATLGLLVGVGVAGCRRDHLRHHGRHLPHTDMALRLVLGKPRRRHADHRSLRSR